MQENRDERLQQIAEKALTDAVVRLVWQDIGENRDAFVTIKGTGFFVDPDLIVTNLHGVAGAPALVAELVSSETQFPVEGVVASDIANDLTVLKVTGEGIPLSLGDSNAVQIGDTVCTVGYPRGEKGVATQVTIHGIRDRDKHFEINEAFDPGQSGSPLLNSEGEVIGVAAVAYIQIS
ncbi:MAG: serine protease, partial [Candidatus Poribacteria bacterium]|nr:serine protease [Candidatus Poribacteria bacterium]